MEFPVVLIKLNQINSLENVLDNILTNKERKIRPDRGDWPEEDKLIKGWYPIPPETTINLSEVPFNEAENFRYIYLRAYVERAKSIVKDSNDRFLDRKDRINYVDQNVLFFENGNNIYLAVYMNFSTYAQAKINYILKDLLFEDVWGSHSILPEDYNITDDVYYWMLRKVSMEEKILCDNPLMTLETFTGFSGVSATDNAHQMTGEGERISALLGTLAFIFGEDSLKSLKIHLNISETENILFELFNKGNIHLLDYAGELFNDYEKEMILLTVYIYKKIIPEILKGYSNARDTGAWKTEIKRSFIDHVGATLITRVKKELEDN